MLATQFQPTHARQSRLLGQTDNPLTLMVRGGEHDGRVIRLSSAKCTIGSARGCTLRLRAAGVRPLHCWILRSPHATLLRSWSADVQLNGAAVRDAYLRTGDRLRIGPVEFEIVAPSAAMPAPSQRSEYESYNQPAVDQGAVNEPSLQQLHLTEECRRLNAELHAAREALRQREAEIEELHCSGPAQTDHHREAFELLRSERDQVHAELASANHYWQLERASLVNRLSEVTALVGEQPRQADEDRRAALEEAKQAAERLVQANNDLQRLRAEMQRERDKFHEVRVTLERDLSAAQAIADEREENIELVRSESIAQTAQLTQLLGELRHEMVCQQAEQQREWESLNTTRTRLERENASLLQRLHESDSRRGEAQRASVPTDCNAAAAQEEYQNQIASLEQQRADLEQECAARGQRIEQLSAELAQVREQLSAASSQSPEANQHDTAEQSSLREEQLALDELRQALTREQQQLAAAQQEFAAERAAAEKDQDQAQADLRERQIALDRQAQSVAEQSAELRERQSELDQQATELQERLAAATSTHQEVEAPRTLDEQSPQGAVASQTVTSQSAPRSPDVVENETAEVQDAPEAVDSPKVEAKPSETAEAAEQSAPAEATEPDESIESYMSRLLQRVRGEGGDKLSAMMPKPKPAAVAQAAPANEQADVAQEQIVAMIEPVTQSEYVPRSQAPEQTVSLAAMRELANSAARTAISTHASKRKKIKAASTLLGGLLSFAASCLLGYWTYQSGSVVAMVGTLVGLLISGYWCARSTRQCLNLLFKRSPKTGA